MISDKLKFVGIHINRTGGASRERILKKYCRPFRKERRHTEAAGLFEVLGQHLWDSYFSFAFVRNPWDRMVSIYHRRHNALKPSRSALAQLPFKKWLLREDTSDATSGEQMQWLTIDNVIVVDFVGRFEFMNRDWKIVCSRIGINVPLPHINKSRRQSYQKYYDKESRKFVSSLCRQDIEMFGYKF